ncbi:MAG: type II secretion system F family protein [Hyphomicrobiaceae bacterium]|nr:type II secretion system F family protein [Hyphomicrobiaceae bacterium]
MFSPEIIQFAVMLLGALAVGGVVYAIATPYFNGEKKTNQRMAEILSDKSEQAKRTPDQKRRIAVQDVLEEIDQRQKESKKVSLRQRLVRAGLSISPMSFYMMSLVCAVVFGFGAFISVKSGLVLPVTAAAVLVGGVGLPRWVVNFLARRRQNKFVAELANAIDIIVRGVKTGLPLNDCIKIIANESPDPIGPEFTKIVEEQRIGVTLGQGIERMYERIPLQEVNFLSIVITIQSSAGGNLAEALQNLSNVLRERKKLEGKVRAFSQEAKSSAAIIGSLPILVMGAVYISKPDYISILFDTRSGNMMLAGSAFWMLCGVLMMRKMINFDY